MHIFHHWGTDNNSTIGLAHFEDREGGLPQIKMFSCAPALEDFTQIKLFEERLAQLSWPKNTSKIDEWREVWSGAFTMAYKQTIQDSSTLTVQLAAEAQNIRNRILDILEVETKNGYVHKLFEKFRDTLIQDMTEQQFADMYAQTVVYGLFSARCLDETQEDFSVEEAIELLPNTNPFLKSLMQECFGANSKSKLSFDELEVGNVIDLLKHTKTDAIIQDFNRQTGGGKEDPVIHFYEEFLTAYDKAQKVQRGVFYTPQPVVNFMVRAVDSILKTEFGYEDGLATEATKTVKYERNSKKKVDGYYKKVEDAKEVPAVQILDPATGTGTFLRQTILQIYENFQEKHKGQPKEKTTKEWIEYVDRCLLPRLNGFELMMAPYAVAHMKLAIVLKDTGYDFSGKHRLNVFLTNSLEEAGRSDGQMSLWDDPLATESIEANEAKKNSGLNVIIGNPPYAVSSSNKGVWVEKLLESYKTEPGGNQKLKEQKHSIDADEIKFIRYAQELINNSNAGIIAYINPHGYLDKPTFRGMRWQLMDCFDSIYILNLHGNSNHQEKTPDGKKDENVFDIQQGVCINIMVKKMAGDNGLAKVYYKDLFGNREDKYNYLLTNRIDEIDFEELSPIEPYFFMVPSDSGLSGQYYEGFCLSDLLGPHLEGIQTGKDKLVIQPSREKLDDTIRKFISLETEVAREEFDLGKDGRDWTVKDAQEDLKNHYPEEGHYIRLGVRPFDNRWSYYTGRSSGFIKCCRDAVSSQMIGKENLALVLTRNAMPQKPYSNFMIVNNCVVGRFIGDFTTSSQVFPIYTYKEMLGKVVKEATFDKKIVKKIETKIDMIYVDCKDEKNETEFNAYRLLSYVYAYLNSWKYRRENQGALCRDFPYIPYPTDKKQFVELSAAGNELIELHLNVKPEICDSKFDGIGDSTVTSVKRIGDEVYINKTQKFSGITDDIWEYWIGGHQIAQKWIKERKGSLLSNDEIETYKRIISLIAETRRKTKEIDYIIKGEK